MANPSVKNVAAAKPNVGGGIYYAVAGTALPTNATTALAAAYKALGYVSEDGLQPTRDANVEKIKAWGGDIVAALLTDDSSSFAFTLIEVFQQDVNTFVYGAANVTWTAAVPGTSPSKVAVVDKGSKPAQCVMVFDMFHGAKKMRVIVPIADPTITGEANFTESNVQGYEVTVEALKDSTGARVYRYYENDDQ